HELGEQLGLNDQYDNSSRDDLMYGYLETGERRLPDAANAAQATTPVVDTAASATLPVASTSGNDVLHVGGGGNILVGSAGADSFVFDRAILEAPTSAPVTHIADYNAAQGDTIDLSAFATTNAPQSVQPDVQVHEDASGAFATLQISTSSP